jgi:hypothetical protein
MASKWVDNLAELRADYLAGCLVETLDNWKAVWMAEKKEKLKVVQWANR